MILSEKEYVTASFRENFAAYADTPMAIYGIGKNTRYILDGFPEYNIIGLMDEARTGDTIYGVPVLPFGELLALGVKVVVIVARAANVKIIYRRFAGQAESHSVSVFDINGNRPDTRQKAAKRFDKYAGITEAALKERIDGSDAVSFDIFDTLIMRKCLYPRDIFLKLEEEFARKRINAETELYAEGGHPNIFDIYARMGGGYSPRAEIELETSFLTPRNTMADILRYAARAGKNVFLTSDMYLPKETLIPILEGLGIHVPPGNILISCDCGASKSYGLFDILRARAGSGKLLHIGDNYESDIISARRCGIDAFRIESAAVMLEDGYGDIMLKYSGELQNRLIIGEFAARQLNDPFLYGKTGGKFEINTHYEMAYSFIAPLLLRISGYLAEMAKALDMDTVLLASRDGYIFEQLHIMLKDELKLPDMKYFYVSRAASVTAGLLDGDDILHAARLAFAGTPEEMLEDRFLLAKEKIMDRGAEENEEDYILRHESAILKAAEYERGKYRRYIDTLGITAGARVGFFDFVSSGTCQKALANIVDFQLIGLYAAAINYATEYKSDTKIEAMYGVLNVFEKTYALLENYFFMENILTSYEPTLSGFDEHGAPTFLPERRSDADFAALREIHKAVLDYARDTRHWNWKTVDIALPDCIFGLISEQYTDFNTRYFADGELQDEFCRRKFSLSLG